MAHTPPLPPYPFSFAAAKAASLERHAKRFALQRVRRGDTLGALRVLQGAADRTAPVLVAEERRAEIRQIVRDGARRDLPWLAPWITG